VECVVEDGASVRGAVFTTGACKVAGTVKTTRKVHFEINAIDSKKKKKICQCSLSGDCIASL
jgi:hypothetical protein